MRVHVEEANDGSFRICEADGRLVYSWLPDLEPGDELPIDRGGFETLGDAAGFALGIDLVRAEHGMISETPAAIEKERRRLDERPNAYGARRESKEDAAVKAARRADARVDRALARLEARLAAVATAETAQFDREALWSAVERPEPVSEPVVVYRRRPAEVTANVSG